MFSATTFSSHKYFYYEFVETIFLSFRKAIHKQKENENKTSHSLRNRIKTQSVSVPGGCVNQSAAVKAIKSDYTVEWVGERWGWWWGAPP